MQSLQLADHQVGERLVGVLTIYSHFADRDDEYMTGWDRIVLPPVYRFPDLADYLHVAIFVVFC